MITLLPSLCSPSARPRPIPVPPPVMKMVLSVSFIEVSSIKLDKKLVSKGSAVLVNEFLQCHRRTATDFLDQIIRPGEDTVLMIDGDFTQMLDDEGISLTFGFWFELAIESPRAMPRGWFLTARGHHCQHR